MQERAADRNEAFHVEKPKISQLKVLMEAYACEPGQGSEPGIGWNWACQMARFCEVWVLTRQNNQKAIEEYLAQHPARNLQFIYYDLPRWARFWKRGNRGVRLYYLFWQIAVLRIARRWHQQVGFSLAHHVTFASLEASGFLWLLPIPFITGPSGGGQVAERNLKPFFGRYWIWELLRTWRLSLLRLNPVATLGIRKAKLCLATNLGSELMLLKLGARHVLRLLDIGVHRQQTLPKASESQEDPLRILWVGVLSPRKGFPLFLESLSALRHRSISFQARVVGDGALREEYTQLAAKLDLDRNIDFMGNIAHAEIGKVYNSSDVFVFTSLRDSSGTVVLEAMSHSLPIVTLDHHGAAEMVTDECGVKVPIQDGKRIPILIADALEMLASDASLRDKMGQAARQRAESQFDWDRRGEFMFSLYHETYQSFTHHKRDASMKIL